MFIYVATSCVQLMNAGCGNALPAAVASPTLGLRQRLFDSALERKIHLGFKTEIKLIENLKSGR